MTTLGGRGVLTLTLRGVNPAKRGAFSGRRGPLGKTGLCAKTLPLISPAFDERGLEQ
jgi:hypothetical protein